MDELEASAKMSAAKASNTKPGKRGRPTTTTTAPEVTTTAPTTTTTTSVQGEDPGSLVGEWRGVYLPHGWIATARTAPEIADRIGQFAPGGFTKQLHNVGALDVDGRVSPDVATGLTAWSLVSHEIAPNQAVIGWISGSEAEHVNVPGRWSTIADSIANLVERAQLDGVMLDLEPFSADNQNYLGLLDAIRARLGSTWLGVTAPVPRSRWSPSFIAAVSGRVDAVSPMAYDSGTTDSDSYVAWVSDALAVYSRNIGPGTQLLPSIPAYTSNRWHDPTVENIASAGRAFEAVGGVEGAAVYWWWEMGPADLASWRQLTG